MTKTFAITEERLLALLNAEEELRALEAAGVDSWGGYDYASEFKRSIDEVSADKDVVPADKCFPVTPAIIAHTQEMYPQVNVKELFKAMGLNLSKNYFISILEQIDE